MNEKQHNEKIWDFILKRKHMDERIFWDEMVKATRNSKTREIVEKNEIDGTYEAGIIDESEINKKSKIDEMTEIYLLEHADLEEDDRITDVVYFQPEQIYIMKGATTKTFPGFRWKVKFDNNNVAPGLIMCSIIDCVVKQKRLHNSKCLFPLNESRPTSFSDFAFYDFAKIKKRYNEFVDEYNRLVQLIVDAEPDSEVVREIGYEWNKNNHKVLKSRFPLSPVMPGRMHPSSRALTRKQPLSAITCSGGKKYRRYFVKTKKRRINRGKTHAKRQNRLHR